MDTQQKSATKNSNAFQAEWFRAGSGYFSGTWNLADNYPFMDIHRTISDFATGIDRPVVDLLPEFEGFNGPELWAHPNNQHPNPEGHRIAGNVLTGFLTSTYPAIIRNPRSHQPLPENQQNNP